VWVKVLILLSIARKFPFFRFLLILGLRVFGVGTRTPFTGGAEALRGAAETLLTDRKDG
jgi:hypothetical protein